MERIKEVCNCSVLREDSETPRCKCVDNIKKRNLEERIYVSMYWAYLVHKE
jgi:hypothetical protein